MSGSVLGGFVFKVLYLLGYVWFCCALCTVILGKVLEHRKKRGEVQRGNLDKIFV